MANTHPHPYPHDDAQEHVQDACCCAHDHDQEHASSPKHEEDTCCCHDHEASQNHDHQGEQDHDTCCCGHDHAEDSAHDHDAHHHHDACCDHDHDHSHAHEEEGHDTCCCGHDHTDDSAHDHDACCDHDHAHDHKHAHAHTHDSCCGHTHDHSHTHAHSHDSCCGHDHHHHDHDHDHGLECSCCCGHDHHHEGSPRQTIIRIVVSLVLLVVFKLLPVEGPLQLVLFLIPYLIAGWDVLKGAGSNLIHAQLMDESFLMALATIGAFAIGEYPEGVFVMVFYQIGEFFQDRAVGKSRESITGLMDLCPDYANVEGENGLIRQDPMLIDPGTIILVKPGEKVPLDGVVVSGNSSLNTAALTGESVPREVGPGDNILNGCVNLDGLLRVKVTKSYDDSTVAKILELVEHSASGKAKTERFMTRFARLYTPIVVYCALAVAIIPPLFLGNWSEWIHSALIFLVVSCPCALVISVPLTFFGGIGGASSRGILIKGSNYLEVLSRCEIMAFDKTGTLTEGQFFVKEIRPAEGVDQDRLLYLAAAAELYSDHPVAQSLREALGKPVDQHLVTDTEVLAGRGIRAVVQGTTIHAGNRKLMEECGVKVPTEEPVGTLVYVADQDHYLGCIVISDRIREDAPQAISGLKSLGVKITAMLTGDGPSAAKQVGDALGLDQVYSSLLPDQKVECMKTLMEKKGEKGTLIYAGDGINDAPVLTLADAGVAMGAIGSDAAIEAADIVLMEDKPSAICTAIRIARKTIGIVHGNIVFSIGIKALVMILGVFGMATMWEAVLADVGVCVVCILNGMRALHVKNL